MDGHYQYTPYLWPSLVTVVLLVALAIFSWRRRAVPGARVFAIGCLLAVPRVAGSVMEAAAVDAADKIFWFKFQGAWQVPAARPSTRAMILTVPRLISAIWREWAPATPAPSSRRALS
jgi:hypothetical protein